MVFGIFPGKRGINELHIIKHFRFTSFARAFPKSAVINQHYIIIIAVKILCIFRPPFDAFRIAMKIKDQTFWMLTVKMQTIDANTCRHIKIQFPERDVIFKFKICTELFRFENKKVLQEINRK